MTWFVIASPDRPYISDDDATVCLTETDANALASSYSYFGDTIHAVVRSETEDMEDGETVALYFGGTRYEQVD